jgi:hypothetical protein
LKACLTMPVETTLYRTLLRLGRRLDAAPAAKALLTAVRTPLHQAPEWEAIMETPSHL